MRSAKQKAEQFIANRRKKKNNLPNGPMGNQKFLPTNDCIPKNILLSRVPCEKDGISPAYGNPSDILGVGGGGAFVLIFFLVCILCKCLGKSRQATTNA